MSNETFQFIITGAVVLACLSMVVQGFVGVALFRASRNFGKRLAPLVSRVSAIIAVEKDSVRRLEIVIDKTLLCADILERVAPRLETLAVRVEAVALHAMQLKVPVTEFTRSVELVETANHLTSLEMRPRLASVAAETSALVRSVGLQSRRVTRVVRDALMHFSHLREIVASR